MQHSKENIKNPTKTLKDLQFRNSFRTLLYLYSAGWDTVSAGAVAYAVSIAFHFYSVLKRAEIERFGYTVS